jgi:hypothetical protein
MPPRVKSAPARLSARQQSIAKAKPVEELVRLKEDEKAKYCLTDNTTIDEKLLMLAAASIADNLHDFAGNRSSLTPKQIDSIIKNYLTLLDNARNQPMRDETKNKIYSEILNIIKTTESGVDKSFKDIYHKYFNNNLTEPELDWSSLSNENNGIMDNFEVIIGNKKALMDLYKRSQSNLFLETLRKIVQKNQDFKDKNIHFVIDVSTIGNDIFVDGDNSKIYKGAAGFFDDFHRPEIHSINYKHEEIPFTVNIQNIISHSNKCILNHVALDNFEIKEDGKLYWKSKYLTDQKEREIKIGKTIPSEFGVSKYSELIDASVKKNPNTVQKILLTRFQEISGLSSSLNSTDYGKHIFDFKRLMDSSQIMYTYYLNKKYENEGKKFIFVTHDNMAAVIARLIGVPCIQTHIYSHIRTISLHLGTNNNVSEDEIKKIQSEIIISVKSACLHIKNLPGYKPLEIPTLSSSFNNYLENRLIKVNPQVNYSVMINNLITHKQSSLNKSNFSLIYIFKLILNIYKSFLNNAKEQLNKYISKLSENIDYNNFKELKDNNDILNVNYTPETLEIDFNYIKSLIDKFNKFEYKESNGTLYKQFYEIIKQDNGYMFSTIDFKMLIVCLIDGIEKKSLKDTMDFYTDSYDKIVFTTEKDINKDKIAFNYFISNKHSLKRYFNQISELNKQYPSSLNGGGYERYVINSEIKDYFIKENLVKDFFESIYKKQDLRDYYHTISKPYPTQEDINIAQKAKNELRLQIENEKLAQQVEARLLERKRSRLEPNIFDQAANKARLRYGWQIDSPMDLDNKPRTSSQESNSSNFRFAPPTPMHTSSGGKQRFSFFKEFQRKLKL